jgi:two-component system, NtrC family, sensor histidine kinase AtoS
MDPKLLVRSIRHKFGSTEVLRGIDFDLYPGEIHALVGERRAGKSTFARILSGDIRKQSGQIFIDGKEVPYLTPRSGLRRKIGTIYQNMNVLPTLNFVDNVFLSGMPAFVGPWRRRRMTEECLRILRRFELDIDIRSPLRLLPESDQQYVELLRLLIQSPDIIILDEISNRRTSAQMAKIEEILNHLRSNGKSIIYITTNVDEIFQLADRVTVLKDGLRKSTERVQDMDRLRLISLAYSFALNLKQGEEAKRGLRMNRLNEELIRSLPAGLILFDSSGRVEIANSEVEKIASSPRDSLRGLGLEEVLDRIGVVPREEMIEAFKARGNETWEKVDYRQGKTLMLKMSPLWDQDSYQGTILFMDDVTMDPQVKEYLSRADQVASIAELAAGVAHEINNPLAIIQNYLLLSKTPSSEEERADNIEKMEGELQRIVEIVQSLLSFSRVGLAQKRRVDIASLLEEVLILLSHKLSEKEVAVRKSWPGDPIVVSVVENKIKQLFINLIVNACEAVLQRGRIELEAERVGSGGEVEIRITDDGYGIAPEIRDKIFAPFFTTKISKSNTGLGLSICQHIVELHGGVLLFDSVPGKTTFTVRLPTTDAASGSAERTPPG